MQRESTSGAGGRNRDVKVHGEAGVNGEPGAYRGTLTNKEAKVK